MANFNKVILAGNLTRDPELRYTPKGTAVAKLGMAINRTWRTETGENREEVTFVDVDCFGKQAEVVSQYLKRGRPILVEGRLKLDSWEDKQTNQKRTRLGVIMESFQFMDSGNRDAAPRAGGDSESSAPPRRNTAPSASTAAPAGDPEGSLPEEDDVPF